MASGLFVFILVRPMLVFWTMEATGVCFDVLGQYSKAASLATMNCDSAGHCTSRVLVETLDAPRIQCANCSKTALSRCSGVWLEDCWNLILNADRPDGEGLSMV